MKKRLFLILSVLMLAACTKDPVALNPGEVQEGKPVTLQLPLKVTVPDEVITRAAEANPETDINSLHVFVFNSAGNVIAKQFIDNLQNASFVSLSAASGTGVTIYGVANMRSANTGSEGNGAYFDGVTTKSQFDAKFAKINGEDMQRTTGMLMFGSLLNQTIDVDGSGVSEPLKLSRLSAKINIDVINKSPAGINLKIVGYDILSLPRFAYVVPDAGNSAQPKDYADDHGSVADLYFDHKIMTDFETGEAIGNGNYHKIGSFYMLENRKVKTADNPGVTPAERQMLKPSIAPQGATCLRIYASCSAPNDGNVTKALVFNIYLGANNSDDFAVARNTNYTYNVTILDASTIDVQVDKRVTNPLNVTLYEHQLDAHFDSREILLEGLQGGRAKVEVLDLSGSPAANSWLKVSDKSNYTAAFPDNSGADVAAHQAVKIDVDAIAGGKAYMYADENIAPANNDRKLKIRITYLEGANVTDEMLDNNTAANTVEQTISQLATYPLGLFGGEFKADPTGGGYTRQLGIELIEEYRKVYKKGEKLPTRIGMQWGYNNVTIPSDLASETGRAITKALAENAFFSLSWESKGINPPEMPLTPVSGENLYQYQDNTNTFAARYCYDKNRDENGNGQLDDDELKWYFPTHTQFLGVWVVYNDLIIAGIPFKTGDYYYAGSWGNNTGSYIVPEIGKSGAEERFQVRNIRCVRDL